MVHFSNDRMVMLIGSNDPAGDYLDYQKSFLTLVQELYADGKAPDLSYAARSAIFSVLEFVKKSMPSEDDLKSILVPDKRMANNLSQLQNELEALRSNVCEKPAKKKRKRKA